MINKLKQISLFFNVDEETLKEISNFCVISTYQKDEIIFFEGEEDKYFYGIVRGNVLMYDVDLKANIIPKHQFSCGDVFGLISQIQNRPYCLSAKATKDISSVKDIYISNCRSVVSISNLLTG